MRAAIFHPKMFGSFLELVKRANSAHLIEASRSALGRKRRSRPLVILASAHRNPIYGHLRQQWFYGIDDLAAQRDTRDSGKEGYAERFLFRFQDRTIMIKCRASGSVPIDLFRRPTSQPCRQHVASRLARRRAVQALSDRDASAAAQTAKAFAARTGTSTDRADFCDVPFAPSAIFARDSDTAKDACQRRQAAA